MSVDQQLRTQRQEVIERNRAQRLDANASELSSLRARLGELRRYAETVRVVGV